MPFLFLYGGRQLRGQVFLAVGWLLQVIHIIRAVISATDTQWYRVYLRLSNLLLELPVLDFTILPALVKEISVFSANGLAWIGAEMESPAAPSAETVQVAFTMEMARLALEVELQKETAFLESYDAVYRQVDERFDVRGSDLANLVMMCLTNGGAVSNHRRKQYQYTVPVISSNKSRGGCWRSSRSQPVPTRDN